MKKGIVLMIAAMSVLSTAAFVGCKKENKIVEDIKFTDNIEGSKVLSKAGDASASTFNFAKKGFDTSFRSDVVSEFSPAVAQVIEEEDSYRLRFVAAYGMIMDFIDPEDEDYKTSYIRDNSYMAPLLGAYNNSEFHAETGFHINYVNASGETIDEFVKVENAYYSIMADEVKYTLARGNGIEEDIKNVNTWLEATGDAEYYDYYDEEDPIFEDEKNDDSICKDSMIYTYFIALEIYDIPKEYAHTVFTAQPYFYYQSDDSERFEENFIVGKSYKKATCAKDTINELVVTESDGEVYKYMFSFDTDASMKNQPGCDGDEYWIISYVPIYEGARMVVLNSYGKKSYQFVNQFLEPIDFDVFYENCSNCYYAFCYHKDKGYFEYIYCGPIGGPSEED